VSGPGDRGGTEFIDHLVKDLRECHPDMKGFPVRNLLFMRSFAEVCLGAEKVKQLVSQLPYYFAVNAMTKPMQVRGDSPPYGGNRR
jgi:hypothetical protein